MNPKTDPKYLELTANSQVSTETIQEYLVHAKGVRVPRDDSKLNVTNCRNWVTKLGLSEKAYAQWEGTQTFRGAVLQFKALNPEWTFKEWALYVSEHLEEISEAFHSYYSGDKVPA